MKHQWQVVHELPPARGDAVRDWWRRGDWIVPVCKVVVALEIALLGSVFYMKGVRPALFPKVKDVPELKWAEPSLCTHCQRLYDTGHVCAGTLRVGETETM